MTDSMRDKLEFLYPGRGDEVFQQLHVILEEFRAEFQAPPPRSPIFSQDDAVLICYADHVQAEGERPLRTMHRFLREHVEAVIPTVHFLPFFPYSSDDGFSVIDYYKINPTFGNWEDVSAIGRDFGLMFDFVINHVSAKCEWFQKFLQGEPKYRDFFIAFDESVDTSSVFRPRTHPLLTPFETEEGTKYIWTTFSADQIDLNFANPEVLLESVRIMLFYVRHGATILRMDAIAFLWKELGTRSLHLPQTHTVVQLWREVLEAVAPNVLIITETNVPHEENISYFGSGGGEAHMVYNFALPPLLLYSLIKGDASRLTAWAQTLYPPSDETSFFNFTASHDGIGVTALRAMVPPEEVQAVVDWVTEHGGHVNYRDVPGQNPVPYELNIVYLDAADGAKQFLASQAVALALRGVPAIYFNSLVGAHNWEEGVERLGYNRAINRQKFDFTDLAHEIGDPDSEEHYVYSTYRRMLEARRSEALFSPLASQTVLTLDPRLFATLRSQGDNRLLAITNFCTEDVSLPSTTIQAHLDHTQARELITGELLPLDSDVTVQAHGTLWLRAEGDHA